MFADLSRFFDLLPQTWVFMTQGFLAKGQYCCLQGDVPAVAYNGTYEHDAPDR